MKKSLLSLLAVAVAAVGCQNYDDQFDDLNTQIAALSSQVAGLAQVQSDLASLAGTVSSLQSTVASTATAIEGLDGLADTVAAISDAVDNVASSEDVANIASDLETAQESLSDLLDQSSVFSGDVVVNSVSTLDVYHKMGASLNVVAGSVKITAKTDMDATKLQELVNNIFTTTKEFTYEADASSVAPVTFDNLTGTQTLTIDQAGDYSFKTLGSATVINLKNSYKSKVTKIDFRELTSVAKFQTNGVDNKIDFSKVVELHLTKLAYYPPLNLTVVVDEGAAMPNALDDVDASGDQSDITLDITGPAAVTFENIEDGSITLKDVKTAVINGFEGAITIKKGVESFSANEVVTLTLSNTIDLETLDITGAKDADVTTSVGPSVTLSSLSSLETVDIDGFVSAITLSSNGNLTDVTIAADVAGKIDIDGNSDLTAVTLTGAKATELDVNNNSDLEALTVDLTFRAGTATAAVLDGTLNVTDNASLASLTVSSDKIESLTVTGNDDLTTVDFTGLEAGGATGSAAVAIYDNDISGTLTDKDDTASTKTGNGEANDLGSISNGNGMATLKTYLEAVDASADSILVLFDTVDFTDESDNTSEVLWADGTAAASQNSKLRVAYITKNTADAGDDATNAKRSFVITSNTTLGIWANNTVVKASGALGANNSVAISTKILTNDATTTATAAGVTMTAVDGGNPVAYIAIGPNSSAAENSVTGAVKTSFAFDTSDTIVLTVEGVSLTYSTAQTGTAEMTSALKAAWEAKYLTAAENRYTLSTEAGVAGNVGVAFSILKFTAKDRGTGSLGKAVSAKTTIASNARTNIGVIIGNDNSFTKLPTDNKTMGDDIVLTFEAATAGSIASEIGYFGKTQANEVKNVSLTGGTYAELSSTYFVNSADSSNATVATNLYPNESRRNDVVMPEELNAAATSNAKSFSRISWL